MPHSWELAHVNQSRLRILIVGLFQAAILDRVAADAIHLAVIAERYLMRTGNPCTTGSCWTSGRQGTIEHHR